MRRLVLWAVRCRFGRRCADLQFMRFTGLEPGFSVHGEYVCGGCGTRYTTSALVCGDGTFVSGGRIRAQGGGS